MAHSPVQKDLRVLVTGASRGIGAAAARAFAATGARVALLARDGAALQALAGQIGAGALALPCDQSDWSAMQAAAGRLTAEWGGVDLLINNAAIIAPIAPLAETDPAEWARTIAINLTGAYHAVRAVLSGMLAAGGGTILTISSGAAHRPVEGWSAYCASKAGLAMVTQSLHLEYAARGIRAMGLSPGTVATDMQRAIKASGIGPVARLEWSDHIPPEWVARALIWMAGPEGAAHAGQELSLRDADFRARLGLVPGAAV